MINSMYVRIAALLTCHNRKSKTYDCLMSLAKGEKKCQIDVFLTDDGSTDGTADMIKNEFPKVHLIFGDGNLYWSRGMYSSWKEALKGDYDYYLWLNDDIILYDTFLEELFECYKIVGGHAIVSGLIEDINKTEIIYGGCNENKQIIKSGNRPNNIMFMNGNVVLVPKSVVDTIGIIDPVFHHDLGDVDYGLSAVENGIKVVSTRIPIGAGYKNNYCRVRKWGVSINKRFKVLYSPLGSVPSINYYYRKKHFGLLNAISYWLYLHIINTLSDKMCVIMFGNKYIDEE